MDVAKERLRQQDTMSRDMAERVRQETQEHVSLPITKNTLTMLMINDILFLLFP